MSILDQLLGGSDQSNASSNSDDQSFDFAAGPQFGLGLSDVLNTSSVDDDGDASEFTGIGGLGIGFAAPIAIGTSSSSDSVSVSESDSDSGGLLGGLL